LSILPTIVGIAGWDWLDEAANEGYPYGLHPLWIYLWHPPLMDVLFGVVVLASFIETRRRWLRQAALLGLASFVVHTLAVVVVVNTQSLFDPPIQLRFLSVVPVAVIATLALTNATAMLAGLRPCHYLQGWSIAAGMASGIAFLLALEIDTSGSSWFWSNGVQWMLWHVSMCIAIQFGCAVRPA